MRRNHAHGEAGFTARTRYGPTSTAADDAYLQTLDRCLIAGVLTDDAIATLRAVRTVTGLDVAEASELVAKAPIELLVDVSEREAKDAEEALLAVGAEVEVLAPEQRRRG